MAEPLWDGNPWEVDPDASSDPALSPATEAGIDPPAPAATELETAASRPRRGVTARSSARRLYAEMLGSELGGYRIDELLGEGGMGAVFLATHFNLGRRAAVKVLSPTLSRDEGLIERFKREARALARLENPYIVPIYDMFVAHDLFCIAMSHAEGGSLRDAIKKQGLFSEREAARIIAQASLGLAAAARAGIVHRDIKPGNLLLSREGRVQIADFGLVKGEEDQDSSLTGLGTFIGTPAYMSPEQFADSRKADQRSDLYALGCTLFELLTGLPPFRGPSIINYCNQHGLADVPDPRILRPELSEEVAAITCRLLQKDPARRFPDGRTLARALKPIAGAIDPSLQASSGQRPGPPLLRVRQAQPAPAASARSPRNALLVGLALGVLVCLGVYAWPGGGSQAGKPPADSATSAPAQPPGLWWRPAAGQTEAAQKSGADLVVRNSLNMALVLVPGGSYLMGSPPAEVGREPDEPQHEEQLQTFRVAACEVTQSQWLEVMGEPNPAAFFDLGLDHPVESVSWFEAVVFCNRLSAREGLAPAYQIDPDGSVRPQPDAPGYRLPSEAEWEYACRAGSPGSWSFGAALRPEQARFASRGGPQAVAQGAANAWGLYDLHGNVWEWCASAYWDYTTGALLDPDGSGHALVVSRGGGWNSSARECRAAMRGYCGPGFSDPSLGFRVARSLER